MKKKIVPIAIAVIIALALVWSIFESLTVSTNVTFSWSLLAQCTLLIVIIVGGWSALRKGNPAAARLTFYAFATVFTIGGTIAFVYGPAKTKSMVAEITGDYVEKTAFDLRSGAPLSMGYFNLDGKWQDAYDPKTGEILTPSDCRPKKYSHFGKSGEVFPYSTHGTCFSPVASGIRLIPISSEALKTSQKLDEPAKTKTVVVNTYPQKSNVQYPIAGQTCDQSFTSYQNCEKITFKGSEGIIRSSQPGNCIGFYPASVVKVEEVGENTFMFKPTSNYTTNVFFYDIPIGETVRGFKCG